MPHQGAAATSTKLPTLLPCHHAAAANRQTIATAIKMRSAHPSRRKELSGKAPAVPPNQQPDRCHLDRFYLALFPQRFQKRKLAHSVKDSLGQSRNSQVAPVRVRSSLNSAYAGMRQGSRDRSSMISSKASHSAQKISRSSVMYWRASCRHSWSFIESPCARRFIVMPE